MNITNAQFTAAGSITALVDGVPMTIPADAGNRHYAAMLEQGITPAAYVAPPPPVPSEMTFAQLLIGLVAEGWITQADGEAWLAGTLPVAVTDLIATLPAEQQFAAKARASRPSTILRTDPLVIQMATAQGKADDLDRFFTTYAAV